MRSVPAGVVYFTCVRAVALTGLTAATCSDGVRVLPANSPAAAGTERMVCIQPPAAAAAGSGSSDVSNVTAASVTVPGLAGSMAAAGAGSILWMP
jgi:hypothetical protein